MGTIGYFIVFAVIFLIGKFIYDSYLTDNTEKRWQEHKSVKSVVDIRAISDAMKDIRSRGRELSLKQLAERFNCHPNEVEKTFLNELETEMTTVQQGRDIIENCRLAKPPSLANLQLLLSIVILTIHCNKYFIEKTL